MKKNSLYFEKEHKLINLSNFSDRVLASVPAMIVVYNIKTGVYCFVNDSVEQILGYKKEVFLQKGLSFVASLVHPDDMEPLMRRNQAALEIANSKPAIRQRNQPIVTFEYRMRHKNGNYRWLHSDGVVFSRDSSGKVDQVMNISIDITGRKEKEMLDTIQKEAAEQTLKTSEKRFRSLIENSTDAIALVDEKGLFTYISPAVKKILGFSPNELIGKNNLQFIPKPYLEDTLKKFEKVGTTPGATQTVEHPYINKDGKICWLESTVTNMLKDPIIKSYVSNFRDITERKETQDELKFQQERLLLALEAGKIGVWDWNLINNHIEWSERVYEIHDLGKKTDIGSIEQYTKFIHPEDLEKMQLAMKDALSGVKPYDIEFRIVTPKGNIKWVSTSAKVIRNSSGKPVRMLGATTDISQRKQLEHQKDEFMGIASHELKTPVTSLKAYAQVLKSRFEKKGEQDSAQMLSKMDSQINKLTSLIQDLLDVTKIEGGRLQFHEESFDFDQFVSEVVEEVQRTTQKHKIVIQGSTHKKVILDKDRIGQVIINFLTNAIKYSPHSKKIEVKIKSKKDILTLSVKDRGVGIPDAELPFVFNRFFRVNSPTHSTVPGIGLGLYISAEIIKRQQGEIWAESNEGKGSTFYFSLPVKPKLIQQSHNPTREELKRS